MKTYLTLLSIVAIVSLAIVALYPKTISDRPDAALAWFRRESVTFGKTALVLKERLARVNDRDSATVGAARTALKNCRLQYKRVAFFLGYFFPGDAMIVNGPPVAESDAANDEIRDPAGLQVIEALLYGDQPYAHRDEMVAQAGMVARSMQNILPLLNDFKVTAADILTSVHLELIRIMTLYITGFDAPQLKTGIQEARVALSTIDAILASYDKNYSRKDSLAFYVNLGKQYLAAHSDFDSFDRLNFITRYVLPAETLLNRLIRETGTPEEAATLNINANHLFAPDAFDKKRFPHHGEDDDSLTVALGKRLFLETALSGDRLRSCATCHMPAAYFTDRMKKNKALDGRSDLPRNTPTLLYAGYQYAQFWDGRSPGLEEQIAAVLNNKTEMNGSQDTLMKRLQRDPQYVAMFEKIWPQDHAPQYPRAASALAAYIRTLTPFRSPFDRYMSGDSVALNAAQKKGFNLFMGKAQCGTCHFAPVFNGLLPPDYKTTEFEILGTPANDDLERPVRDTDMGRYIFFPGIGTKGAFKTPTIRNAAMTAPFMHNGAFHTLNTVVEFYDRGGGEGLGLRTPEQTLSPLPLHLTAKEKSDLISFIEALTDK